MRTKTTDKQARNSAKWYQANKEAVKEKSREYRRLHREQVLAYKKEVYKNNKEKMLLTFKVNRCKKLIVSLGVLLTDVFTNNQHLDINTMRKVKSYIKARIVIAEQQATPHYDLDGLLDTIKNYKNGIDIESSLYSYIKSVVLSNNN